MAGGPPRPHGLPQMPDALGHTTPNAQGVAPHAAASSSLQLVPGRAPPHFAPPCARSGCSDAEPPSIFPSHELPAALEPFGAEGEPEGDAWGAASEDVSPWQARRQFELHVQEEVAAV
eukprot:737995-Pleurochrysis_carterae.AAC.1